MTADPLWRRACRAYNVQLRLSGECRAGLAAAQDRLEALGPGLLRCPAGSLHVSVAPLLGVRVEYGRPKDDIWARHEDEWAGELRRIAAETPAFTLVYRRVVATDAAVIAVADDPGPVNRIRAAIDSRLWRPPRSRVRLDIAHTTLFRYSGNLRSLPGAAGDVTLSAVTEVRDLVISKELVYPSLVAEDLYSFPLGVVT